MIYALKTIGTVNDEYVQPKLFKDLKSGKARFGWSYQNTLNLNIIHKKLLESNWDFSKLDSNQATVWDKTNFLLNIRKDDYLVYINQPKFGYCSIFQAEGPYNFDHGVQCEDFSKYDAENSSDFRHYIPGKFINTFQRNRDKLNGFLYQRLILRGRWWRIKAEDEFQQLLQSLEIEKEKGISPQDKIENTDMDFSIDSKIKEEQNLIDESGLIQIFISYSRKDKKYLDQLLVYLKPLERQNLVKVWSDIEIKAGDIWEEKIAEAMEKAQVAILLVSSDFLSSDFISNVELPKFLQATKKDGLNIKPIILNPMVRTISCTNCSVVY